MPTRKQFCQGCLAMLLAGLGAPLLAGLNCRRPPEGLAGRGRDEVKKEGAEKAKKRIAACGLACGECPAYIATQKNDDALRAETARKWSEMFQSDIQPADIHCDGCLSGSQRLFGYCAACEIRACAVEKKLANCAACPDYSCGKLDKFLAQVPEARKTLEELRKDIPVRG